MPSRLHRSCIDLPRPTWRRPRLPGDQRTAPQDSPAAARARRHPSCPQNRPGTGTRQRRRSLGGPRCCLRSGERPPYRSEGRLAGVVGHPQGRRDPASRRARHAALGRHHRPGRGRRPGHGSGMLGHSDIRVTRGYTHVSSLLAQDAAAKLGRALFGETATKTAPRSHDH